MRSFQSWYGYADGWPSIASSHGFSRGRLIEVAVDADVAWHGRCRGYRGGVELSDIGERPAPLPRRLSADAAATSRLCLGRGFRKTAPSGGSVSDRLCERPCAGTGSATARPRLPTPLPP